MSTRRPRPSGGLESEVLACLGAHGAAMTPAEVQAELGTTLAYTTVMTTLARLHAKGALTRTARGRAFAYELIGGSGGAQAGIAAHQMRKLLADAGDRASVLSRFVDGLSADDERVLRDALERDLPERADAEPGSAERRGEAAVRTRRPRRNSK